MVNCPECDAAIDVEEDELDEGEQLICEECGVHLVVSDVDPLELDVDREASDADDDDDYEFDEDEEDEDEEDEEEEEEDDWR
jgi:lysine biosynthesis protein LysW